MVFFHEVFREYGENIEMPVGRFSKYQMFKFLNKFELIWDIVFLPAMEHSKFLEEVVFKKVCVSEINPKNEKRFNEVEERSPYLQGLSEKQEEICIQEVPCAYNELNGCSQMRENRPPISEFFSPSRYRMNPINNYTNTFIRVADYIRAVIPFPSMSLDSWDPSEEVYENIPVNEDFQEMNEEGENNDLISYSDFRKKFLSIDSEVRKRIFPSREFDSDIFTLYEDDFYPDFKEMKVEGAEMIVFKEMFSEYGNMLSSERMFSNKNMDSFSIESLQSVNGSFRIPGKKINPFPSNLLELSSSSEVASLFEESDSLEV